MTETFKIGQSITVTGDTSGVIFNKEKGKIILLVNTSTAFNWNFLEDSYDSEKEFGICAKTYMYHIDIGSDGYCWRVKKELITSKLNLKQIYERLNNDKV